MRKIRIPSLPAVITITTPIPTTTIAHSGCLVRERLQTRAMTARRLRKLRHSLKAYRLLHIVGRLIIMFVSYHVIAFQMLYLLDRMRFFRAEVPRKQATELEQQLNYDKFSERHMLTQSDLRPYYMEGDTLLATPT